MAYNSLLLAQRQALHWRIAAALERQASHADRLESQYATLADHYERGGLWPKALEYRRKAGARAQRLYDNSVAVAPLEPGDGNARPLGTGAAESAGRRRKPTRHAARLFRCAARRRCGPSRGDVLALTGQYDQAQADFQAALEHCQECRVARGAVLAHRLHSRKVGPIRCSPGRAANRPRAGRVRLPIVRAAQAAFHAGLGLTSGKASRSRRDTVSVRSLALCKARNSREAALALKSLGYAAFIQGRFEPKRRRTGSAACRSWSKSATAASRSRSQHNLGMIAARRGTLTTPSLTFSARWMCSNALATRKRLPHSTTTWAARTRWPGSTVKRASITSKASKRTSRWATRSKRQAAK